MSDGVVSTPTGWVAWCQIGAIVLLTVLGSLLGALTGFPALAPVTGMLLPLLAATAFLRQEGRSWRDLGFARAMAPGRCLRVAAGALVVIYLLTGFVVAPLLESLDAPALDVSLIEDAVKGNLAAYLWFLIPVTWGSAAFGEELLARGFLLHRFEGLAGTQVAVVAQALIFAAGHFYQGVTGVANIFVVALVLGWVYVRVGRNLWPVIIAHGAIDTIGITLLYLGYGEALAGV